MVATPRVGVAYLPPNVTEKRVLGVDVGGTKILAGIGDPTGKVANRRERPTRLESQERPIAGVVIDGKLLRDGGELGHTVLIYDGVPCQGTCTGRGHLEALVSGTAAAKLAREAFGPGVDAHRLVRLAAEGDSTAIEILDGIGRMLGAAIGSFVNIFRPQLVVIGGGVFSAGGLLPPPAPATLRREALAPARDHVEIVRAELGTAAGMIGAALVAYDELASVG